MEFDDGELEGLRDVCIFVVRLYVKDWFNSTSAVNAPRNDLNFIKEAIDYSSIDESVSKIILNKISNHLWYLSEETVGFAFFDEEVSIDEKKKMVRALRSPPLPKRRLSFNANQLTSQFKQKHLHNFVTTNTRNFFARFDIPTGFLSVEPSEWSQRDDYKQGFETCKVIHVVNDSAERAVKLFLDYNQKLTHSEEQKQFIPKVVQHYRQIFPSSNKFDLGN